MKKDDFVSTIGYSGNTAIVDKKLQKSGNTVDHLLEKGHFKSAFSKALYDDNQDEMKKVLDLYNKISASDYKNTDELKRLFGVFRVPGKITKVNRI